jgi:hypothetical protein
MKKVIIGNIGDLEVYLYPFDFPDKAFIGKFPVSTPVSRSDLSNMMGIINTLRWFFDGKAFSEPKRRKAANARRRAIVSAYNLALSELRSKKQGGSSYNYNYTSKIEVKTA